MEVSRRDWIPLTRFGTDHRAWFSVPDIQAYMEGCQGGCHVVVGGEWVHVVESIDDITGMLTDLNK